MNTPSRFIVIDDDDASNFLCCAIIEQIAPQMEIKTFTLPETGFEFLLSNYSKTGDEFRTILFLDINMPTWSGWDFLNRFDKLDERIKRQIKIYMLTSSVDARDKQKAHDDKIAIEFVVKPLTARIVNDIVHAEKSDFEKIGITVTTETEIMHIADPGITAIKKIALASEKKQFRKKEILFTEGSINEGLIYILNGKVKTYKTNCCKKEFITALYQQDDFLGYVSLLKNKPHEETAMALENVEAAIIEKDIFKNLLQENQEIYSLLFQQLAHERMEKENRMLSLAYDSVRQRVAGSLLQLQKKYHDGHTKNFSTQFTREDLANMVGTATESLIRSLSDLKEEGAVEINNGSIIIKNQQMLERIAQ